MYIGSRTLCSESRNLHRAPTIYLFHPSAHQLRTNANIMMKMTMTITIIITSIIIITIVFMINIVVIIMGTVIINTVVIMVVVVIIVIVVLIIISHHRLHRRLAPKVLTQLPTTHTWMIACMHLCFIHALAFSKNRFEVFPKGFIAAPQFVIESSNQILEFDTRILNSEGWMLSFQI